MADVAQLLQENFKNLNEQQRADAFYNLFGSDAVRAASILYKEGAKGINEMYKQMSDVTALEVARKKMDNAAGSVEQLKGAFETLQIKALRPTLPYIKKLANAIGDFVEKNTPAITKGVQDGVDAANSYLHTHFIDNPDFQKLDKQGKIKFIFDDLGNSFTKWFDESGRTHLQTAATEITATLTKAIGDNSQGITEAALKIGTSIATGIVNGYKQFMADYPLEAGIIAGLMTPGTPLVKAAVAIGTTSTAVQNNVTKNLEGDGIMRTPEEQQALIDNAGEWFDKNVLPIFGIHRYDENGVKKYAKSGFINRPHLGMVGEAGPEAIIPLNGSARAKSIWQTTGKALGMNTGGGGGIVINAPFAPVIHGAGAEIIPLLQQEEKNFQQLLQNEIDRQRRVSFNG
jgi:hypothetical protein